MRTSAQRRLGAVALGVAALCMATPAARAGGTEGGTQGGDSFHYFISSGLDYSSGKYGGTSTTRILYAPLTVQARFGFFRLRVSSGWMEIDGDGVIAGVDGPIVLPGGGSAHHTSGLADTVVQAGVRLTSGVDFPCVELVGKVKLPTADKDKALGTGEVDYAAQVDVYQTFGATTIFGTAGYKVYGDPPTLDLNDVPYGSAGVSFKASPQWSLGGSIDWRQKITSTSGDKLQITPFAKFKLATDWSIIAYGDAGLADGSPDWGGGFAVKWGT
jgi:hypothetical protein